MPWCQSTSTPNAKTPFFLLISSHPHQRSLPINESIALYAYRLRSRLCCFLIHNASPVNLLTLCQGGQPTGVLQISIVPYVPLHRSPDYYCPHRYSRLVFTFSPIRWRFWQPCRRKADYREPTTFRFVRQRLSAGCRLRKSTGTGS